LLGAPENLTLDGTISTPKHQRFADNPSLTTIFPGTVPKRLAMRLTFSFRTSNIGDENKFGKLQRERVRKAAAL